MTCGANLVASDPWLIAVFNIRWVCPIQICKLKLRLLKRSAFALGRYFFPSGKRHTKHIIVHKSLYTISIINFISPEFYSSFRRYKHQFSSTIEGTIDARPENGSVLTNAFFNSPFLTRRHKIGSTEMVSRCLFEKVH